ncbi:MAG: hypothetical protein KJ621_01380 [Proteobacteria bacterium]|nr:hypothetical protein [Pseudomonadota bacterium]MBU1741174.1 hypothetical protein [Pseudomonadota bacterium]
MGGTDPLARLQDVIQSERDARATGQQLYHFLRALAALDRLTEPVRRFTQDLAHKLGDNHFSPSSLTAGELRAVELLLSQPPDFLDGLTF